MPQGPRYPQRAIIASVIQLLPDCALSPARSLQTRPHLSASLLPAISLSTAFSTTISRIPKSHIPLSPLYKIKKQRLACRVRPTLSRAAFSTPQNAHRLSARPPRNKHRRRCRSAAPAQKIHMTLPAYKCAFCYRDREGRHKARLNCIALFNRRPSGGRYCRRRSRSATKEGRLRG